MMLLAEDSKLSWSMVLLRNETHETHETHENFYSCYTTVRTVKPWYYQEYYGL